MKNILFVILVLAFSEAIHAKEIINIESSMRGNILYNNKLSAFNSLYCKPLANAGLVKRAACLANMSGNIQKSTVSNITAIASGAISYSEIKPAPIPLSIEKDFYAFSNCTSTTRKQSEEVSITTQNTYSISTSKTITINSTSGSNYNVALDLSYIKIGGSGNKSANFTEVTGSTNQNSGSETVTRKYNISEDIPPYKALVIIWEKTMSHSTQDFSGEVIIDGSFSNVKGEHSIVYSSLIYPNNPVTLSGTVYGSDFTNQIEKKWIEVDLPVDAIGCNNFNVKEYLASNRSAPLGTNNQVITLNGSFTDAVITTAKPAGLGIVQVRSKGSSDSCSFEVGTRESSPISYMSYNGGWSDWKSLDYYTDSKNIYIYSSGSCNDSTTEVRYY